MHVEGGYMDKITKLLWASGIITDEQFLNRLRPSEYQKLKRLLYPTDEELQTQIEKILQQINQENNSEE